MKKVNVFLADGFEEIEALTVVDLLRRAGVTVTMVSVTGETLVHGAHGIDVRSDILFEEMDKNVDLLVLPGGMPGTIHLKEHSGVTQILREFHEKEKMIAAICAAPTVLGGLGFLKGRKAVCYPSMEEGLTGAQALTDEVVTDGHITTSRGLGTAIPFSLELIRRLCGQEKADEIRASVVYRQ